MLRIDRSVVDELARASSAAEITGLVQQAVRLEFSTVPPYLTAMMSLKPDQNRDIWWAIHDVVVDEMLHMLIGCNLLNALGARPALDAGTSSRSTPVRCRSVSAPGSSSGWNHSPYRCWRTCSWRSKSRNIR